MDNSIEKISNSQDKFHPEIRETTDRLFLKYDNVQAGHMFGYPAYYLNRKLITCHYGDGLALKLYKKTVAKTLSDGNIVAEPFCPMGRKMGKHWIITYKRRDINFALPSSFVEEAMEFAKMQSD